MGQHGTDLGTEFVDTIKSPTIAGYRNKFWSYVSCCDSASTGRKDKELVA